MLKDLETVAPRIAASHEVAKTLTSASRFTTARVEGLNLSAGGHIAQGVTDPSIRASWLTQTGKKAGVEAILLVQRAVQWAAVYRFPRPTRAITAPRTRVGQGGVNAGSRVDEGSGVDGWSRVLGGRPGVAFAAQGRVDARVRSTIQ